MTDSNPCLELLNFFCLTQLGTNENEALEQELRDDYVAGMIGFAERMGKQEWFWRFKKEFDERVASAPHRFDLSELDGLQEELTARIHLSALRRIGKAYRGD